MIRALFLAAALVPQLAQAQAVGCAQVAGKACRCYASSGRVVDMAPGLCEQQLAKGDQWKGGALRFYEPRQPKSDQVEPLRMPLPLVGMGDVRKIVREAAIGP